MVGTRAVLKLKDVVQRAEQGILDDTTDIESVLDMDVDTSDMEAVLSAQIAEALTKAVEPPPTLPDETPASPATRSATTPP